MYFDAQIIDVRIGLRQAADHLAGSEADFQAAARVAPENAAEIQRRSLEIKAKTGPKLLERSLLPGGGSTGSQDKTADAAGCGHCCKVCLISCLDAYQPPKPSSL